MRSMHGGHILQYLYSAVPGLHIWILFCSSCIHLHTLSIGLLQQCREHRLHSLRARHLPERHRQHLRPLSCCDCVAIIGSNRMLGMHIRLASEYGCYIVYSVRRRHVSCRQRQLFAVRCRAVLAFFGRHFVPGQPGGRLQHG